VEQLSSCACDSVSHWHHKHARFAMQILLNSRYPVCDYRCATVFPLCLDDLPNGSKRSFFVSRIDSLIYFVVHSFTCFALLQRHHTSNGCVVCQHVTRHPSINSFIRTFRFSTCLTTSTRPDAWKSLTLRNSDRLEPLSKSVSATSSSMLSVSQRKHQCCW
jgi:hypothetical protein